MPETHPPAPTQITSRVALIVDSNPELNRQLTTVFERESWRIALAANNSEALDLAKARQYDLIITGEGSTGVEDIELLRRMRLVRPHTRLIILTHEFTPGDVLAAIRERAFSYFSRPFSVERLEEMIRIAMSEPFWDDGIEVLSFVPNWIRLCVRCDLATANRLLQFYREASDLPDMETEEVAAAFREMLLNAMEHGAHFDPSQHVEVSYVRTKRMVLCRVKDPGQGFSMEELQHSAIANPDEDPFKHMEMREAQGKRPGGFGILMAKRLVDDLIYNEKGNDVLLVKYLNRPAATSRP
ncbi:MAG TPA: ATP-binding protein [Candidatus Eisenbacteria bacterium]|nr:ATP-binding protein [Candidatus Eisenbacteria bacterium]